MWNNISLKGVGLVYKPDKNSNILYQKIYEDIQNQNNLNILEIGCGSGAIGLALKKNSDNNITLSDINDIAIQYTRENAQNNNLDVNIIESDMFKNIPANKYDIIFSNIPFFSYNNDAYKIKYDTFIPITSYIVGNDSDEDILLKELIIKGTQYLTDGGLLYFQTGSQEQLDRMTQLLQENNYINIEYFNTNTNKLLFIKAQYYNI